MPSLSELLSVDLILLHLTPYLTISSLLSLAATSKRLRHIVYQTPGSFRYVDLSTCKGGTLDIAPIDRGGEIWRSERMDESMTEDDFYGGPMRGILSKFRKRNVLKDIQTLILDRQSVTSDILHEIICGDEFRVRILSLLEVKHLNMNKLQQTLKYACRPSRAEGRPWLKGVYIFSDPEPLLYQDLSRHQDHVQLVAGVTASTGAQLGAQYNQRSRHELFGRDPHPYYKAAGGRQVLYRAAGWEPTLNFCKDIIAFDAVLCRGPRHDPLMGAVAPAIASEYLGPKGCEACGTMPEGPAVAGKSPISEAPMLRPPPLHSSSVREAQLLPYPPTPQEKTVFIARCRDCLADRWCEGCSRFWCERCYQPTCSRQQIPPIPSPNNDPHQHPGQVGTVNAHVKRKCLECGYMCDDCNDKLEKSCKRCKFKYCVVHNEGSTDTLCDWCRNNRVGGAWD